MAERTATIGTHTIELVAPDIVIYRFRGRVDASDIDAMTIKSAEWCSAYLLACIDTDDLGEITSAALRASRSGRPQNTPRAFAVVGDNFNARVAMDMLTRALRFLSKTAILLQYAETEEQALAWLVEVRPLLKAAVTQAD